MPSGGFSVSSNKTITQTKKKTKDKYSINMCHKEIFIQLNTIKWPWLLWCKVRVEFCTNNAHRCVTYVYIRPLNVVATIQPFFRIICGDFYLSSPVEFTAEKVMIQWKITRWIAFTCEEGKNSRRRKKFKLQSFSLMQSLSIQYGSNNIAIFFNYHEDKIWICKGI